MQDKSTRESYGVRDGYFYAILLVPESMPNRIKFGWTVNVQHRFGTHRCTSPTAVLLKTWPCKRYIESLLLGSIAKANCTPISGEVFDCPDTKQILAHITMALGKLRKRKPPTRGVPLPLVVKPDPPMERPPGPGTMLFTVEEAAQELGLDLSDFLGYMLMGSIRLTWIHELPRIRPTDVEALAKSLPLMKRLSRQQHLQIRHVISSVATYPIPAIQ